jgi:hypothetical protein
MAITRANAEAILVRRAGKKMALVGFAVTTLGTNPDLNDPIGTALMRMGKSVSNISQVADTDLAGLSMDEVPEFLDRAELRLLESILGNYDLTDVSLGGRNESFNQIVAGLEAAVEAKLKHIAMNYASFEAGSYIVDQQAQMDDV